MNKGATIAPLLSASIERCTLSFLVTVHGGVHHAHKRQSLAKQKLWVLCASKYRT